MSMWHLDVALALVVVALFVYDRLAGLNRLADDLEKTFPTWLTWTAHGDPITWAHHALITLGVGLCGAVLATAAGLGFQVGFAHWASIAALAYIAREAITMVGLFKMNAPGKWWRGGAHRTGWLVDGIMDVVGPVLVAWLGWIS